MAIIDNYHPDYHLFQAKWQKWRLTYKSGPEFINNYLYKFSRREEDHNFALRRNLTYVPAFAKSAINDIKNSIYQRAIDIIRDGGSSTYQQCVFGVNGGVDRLGSTMSYFIGQRILPELLPMGKVGVYVDMPTLLGPTKLHKGNSHPYFCIYPIEDIINYACGNDPNEFAAILLRTHDYLLDETTGLPTSRKTCYHYIFINDQGTVTCQMYSDKGDLIDQTTLSINKIPFVIADLGTSIISDVCDYQIALMNMESSDVAYVLLANYPFYIEEFDPLSESLYNKGSEEEIETGVSQGRRYPKGTNPPSFINPSPDPLRASIDKENQLKADIKSLVNNAVSNLAASAESKAMDLVGLESGLSCIGLVLENLENRLAYFWSLYESASTPIIIYPTEYSLPDQVTVGAKIDKALEIIEKINSPTLKKSLAKRIARLIVGNRLPASDLAKIDNEIDNANIIITDPKTIINDVINGILDPETASQAKGYPVGVVEAAQEYQARRVAMIQAAQSSTPIANAASRGVNDLAPVPNNASAERLRLDGTPKPVRGEGK